MSDHTEHLDEAHPTEHAHPSSGLYIRIAIILGIITAIEVAIVYIFHEGSPLHGILSPTLIALSAVKFAIVAGFYMHLKFDSKLFTFLFVGGLAIAASIVLAFMTLFGAWWQAPIAPPIAH